MRTIKVQAKPRSQLAKLEDNGDGTWTARVKAPPVDGKANEAIVELVADHFGVSKRAVSIKSGHSARWKWVEIVD